MGQKLTLVIDRLHSPIRKLPIERAHFSDAHGSLARLRVCSRCNEQTRRGHQGIRHIAEASGNGTHNGHSLMLVVLRTIGCHVVCCRARAPSVSRLTWIAVLTMSVCVLGLLLACLAASSRTSKSRKPRCSPIKVPIIEIGRP